MLANVKPVTASLKVKVMVTSVLSKTMEVGPTTETMLGRPSTSVGLVSMLKLPLALVPTPALPCASWTPARFTRVVVGGVGVDGEVAAGAGAHSGVALRVLDAGEVHADGVGGAFDAAVGCVGGCPDPAVGAHRRQRAQRAFAGVVLDVRGIKAGDALAEGEGDGGGFSSGQALVADRHRDLGPPVDHGRPGVDAEVAAADAALSGVALRVQHAGEVHADGVVGALDAAAGRVGGCPDPAVGADRRQSAQRAFAGAVLDVCGIKAGDALA